MAAIGNEMIVGVQEQYTIINCPNCGRLRITDFRYNQCPICGAAVLSMEKKVEKEGEEK